MHIFSTRPRRRIIDETTTLLLILIALMVAFSVSAQCYLIYLHTKKKNEGEKAKTKLRRIP